MPKTEFDYIIVGQGLAGSLLSYFLLKAGKTILIIDGAKEKTASKIAAGIVNPVTGRRLVKSWRVDEFLPFINQVYVELEKTLQAKFFHHKTILRVLANEEEMDFWQKRKNDFEYENYVAILPKNNSINPNINVPHGFIEIKGGGYLDTKTFLDSYKIYLEDKTTIIAETFDFSQLIINENRVLYKDFTAKKIIFCEGYKAIENPYFKNLPFNFAKGETLQFSSKINLDDIVVKGKYLVPMQAPNEYKMGATYVWETLEESPTEEGKSELTSALKSIINLDFKIISQDAGIRPTVKDRRPFIGFHPIHKNIAIFNGMGTKGVLLAPYFAKHFTEVLLGKVELEKEVDILRYQDFILPN
ncbi:MAG: FAD-binding oxidoreductase [Bacteroidetes bacterium]|nr:FAD-binding oxidoreductase [Bacteroidota bacterium]